MGRAEGQGNAAVSVGCTELQGSCSVLVVVVHGLRPFCQTWTPQFGEPVWIEVERDHPALFWLLNFPASGPGTSSELAGDAASASGWKQPPPVVDMAPWKGMLIPVGRALWPQWVTKPSSERSRVLDSGPEICAPSAEAGGIHSRWCGRVGVFSVHLCLFVEWLRPFSFLLHWRSNATNLCSFEQLLSSQGLSFLV